MRNTFKILSILLVVVMVAALLAACGKSAQVPLQSWLGDAHIALYSVIAVDVWKWLGFHAVIYLAGLQTIPTDLYESATMDGASRVRRFWHITLPLVWPFIMVAIVIRTIDALKAFDTIFVITQGGPGTASETLNIFLYLQAFQFYKIGYASAVVVIFFVIIIMLSLLLLYARQKSKWNA